MGKFHIEPGNCYCLITYGESINFKVTGWNGTNYEIELFDGTAISLSQLTHGGLSDDFILQQIPCPIR